MPSQILHSLFGEDCAAAVLKILDTRYGEEAGRARAAWDRIRGTFLPAFTLGCQGPDIFYHSQRLRPAALEYGSLLHRRGYGVFSAALMRVCLPAETPGHVTPLTAYAMGFLTHAALDRAAHPFIIYFSAGSALGRTGHAFFERIIDAAMLRELRGTAAAEWDQQALLADICAIPPDGLLDLLAGALQAIYPDRGGTDKQLAKRMSNAFKDCAHFYGMSAPAKTAKSTLPPLPGTKPYLFPPRLPDDIDFLNREHKRWQYPYVPGAETGAAPRFFTASFPEIYAAAVEAAAETFAAQLGRYLEEGVFPIKDAAQAIGNGSLSLQDEHGKPAAANISDPLPLERVLEY